MIATFNKMTRDSIKKLATSPKKALQTFIFESRSDYIGGKPNVSEVSEILTDESLSGSNLKQKINER